MQNEEIWKEIPGYEGLYEASTHGRIRSREGKETYTNHHGIRRWKSRILKGRGDRHNPGKRVSLWKNGERKEYLVARLVASTFIGEPPHNFTVNHKDGDRMNNRLENLEWLSHGDNIRHAFDTGLMPFKKAILLKSEGETIEFSSMAEASRYIGRNTRYLSGQIKRGYQIKGADGKHYTVVKE